MYGRVIIAERNLPVGKKSIKPTELGGVAGGSKYLVHDILFKFPDAAPATPQPQPPACSPVVASPGGGGGGGGGSGDGGSGSDTPASASGHARTLTLTQQRMTNL